MKDLFQPNVKTKSREEVISDLMRPVNLSLDFKAWMGFLVIALGICLYFYWQQLQVGLGVTGMRDYVSWGMYIANFVFFVAASLVGMLISAVLGLIGYKWIIPLTRIAEIIAVAFAAIAGLVIVSDMGRPDRLPYVFIYGRIQSPILWDVTVVTTYLVISALLLYIPLIPDLKLGRSYLKEVPPIHNKLYQWLALNWQNQPAQRKIIHRSMRTLLILIIPVAFAIHTVTSWLFAVTPRVGWDSTIFGPYFLSGAFVAGAAGVIIAMYFFRKSYKLKDYITNAHFDKMGQLLVLVSIIYFYFNLNEFLVPGYKLKDMDAIHLHTLFAGRHALMFWLVQIVGLILPICLLLFKKIRKPLPLMIISIFVILGAWFKRYIIVVPTQEHPHLPIQNVPEIFKVYAPTLPETLITLGSLILVLIIITMLSKFFPVIPIYETLEAHEEASQTQSPE